MNPRDIGPEPPGSFVENKEVLGGFALIDVEHLDASIEWAFLHRRLDEVTGES